jgi:hypothetical protein
MWSESIDGVQGRLIIKETSIFNETHLLDIFLELRNTSNIVSPTRVYFDFGRSLRIQAMDSANVLIAKPVDASMSVWDPGAYWLVLPPDSSLRFRVSVSGFGIPKKGGMAIQVMQGLLLIAPNVKQDCYLLATFTSEPDAKMPDEWRAWKGTIKLPKVLIPRLQ